MRRHSNLISDSALILETVDLLRANGGILHAADVAETVLQTPVMEAELAAMLIADLIETDPRLVLREDLTVELVSKHSDSRQISETDFVVFDLETTGAKAASSRVMEIGAYKVSNGKIVDEFETLINPTVPIPPFINALTGINNEMVRNAPRFSEVVSDLLDFIGDSVLVAHNAQFDVSFLNYEVGRIFSGYKVCNSHLCTVRLSRKLLPELENHRLHTVAEHYSIPIFNRHRAGGDALATAKIFINFLEKFQENNIRDIASLRKFKL